MFRRHLGLVLVLILVTTLTLTGLATSSPTLRNDMPDYLKGFQRTVNRQVSIYPDVYYLSGPEDVRAIALTFDDGPAGDATSQLLDLLAEERVRATFFVVGEKAQEQPDLIQRIVDEDHELGNHSWSHSDMRKYTNQHILDNELKNTSQVISDTVGLAPSIMRPPYGALRDETIEFLAEERWFIINWSIDSFDWDTTQNSPEEITEKVLEYSHPGAIVLMHTGEGLDGTIAALPEIIRVLREGGYEFVTVSELLGL